MFALANIRFRVVDEQSEFDMSEFFDKEFWIPKWRGTLQHFLSFVSFLVKVQVNEFIEDKRLKSEGHNQVDMLGEILVETMNVDIAPYQTFQEMRLCIKDWDYQKDLGRLSSIMSQDINESVFDQLGIQMNPHTQLNHNLNGMRCDYLITILNINENYERNHYLFMLADTLNTTHAV